MGTPLIASAAVEPMATAYGVSSRTAAQQLSDWLDVKYRLPMIHRGQRHPALRTKVPRRTGRSLRAADGASAED